MKTARQTVGKRGEDEACAYLRGLGHSIIARNWRSGHQEIDIVSLDSGGIHFVEVKSLTAPVTADPVLKVNAPKMHNIVRAAQAFIRSQERKCLPCNPEIFFDVVTVIFENNRAEITYYPQAFIPTYV